MFLLLLLACSTAVTEPQAAPRFLCSGPWVVNVGSGPIVLATCLDTGGQDCFVLATAGGQVDMMPVSCPDVT